MGINTLGAVATDVAAAFIFHRALLVTLVWIRAQSDIRLHRKYTLAMMNKRLCGLQTCAAEEAFAPRTSRQERQGVLENH